MLRWVGIITLGLIIASCGLKRQYASEVISGDATSVAIKSGKAVNPGEEAKKHCASYGKSAVLVKQEQVGGNQIANPSLSYNDSIFYFDCK